MSTPLTNTYAQSAYAQARSFSYADDASFASIAATFTSRTAMKTAAVAIAVIQTAFYAVLSAATYPVSFISPKGHERFSARMNATSGVIKDVAKSAVWGDPKTQSNPNAAKPLATTRVKRLKTGAAALLAAAKQKASSAASGASALATQAKQKVSSAATGTTTFAKAHKREILIASVVVVATAAAVVAAYHFGVFGQVKQAASTATSSEAKASAIEAQSVVNPMGPASVVNPMPPAICPLANATIFPPSIATASNPAAPTPSSQVPQQEGFSNAQIFAAATVGVSAVAGGVIAGPAGIVAGVLAVPVFTVASIIGTLGE